jgi:hypothetical protein
MIISNCSDKKVTLVLFSLLFYVNIWLINEKDKDEEFINKK